MDSFQKEIEKLQIKVALLEDKIERLEKQERRLAEKGNPSESESAKAWRNASVANVMSIFAYVLALLAFLSKYF